MIVGALIMLPLTPLLVHPLPNFGALDMKVIAAIVTLGVVNTFIAYQMYFTLIHEWGASRATMITYALPPISIFLGVVFNSEPLDWRIIVGTVLIVGGIGLANIIGEKRHPVSDSAKPLLPNEGK